MAYMKTAVRESSFSESLDYLHTAVEELMAERGVSRRAAAEAIGVNYHAFDRFLLSEGRHGHMHTVLLIAAWVEELQA